MVKLFFKRNRLLILFNIILVLCFILGYGRFGDVVIDSFREAYIPEQILAGQVLYKNIFGIYPPLAYLINAGLFAIFGINLKVLYFAGFAAAAGILNLTYKISLKFLPKLYSLSIVLFIIAAAVLSPNVFNLIFPYSFGVLYGVLFALGSLYCVLKRKYTAAYFLYALAICSKYEFILLLPVIVWVCGRKDIVKKITAFILPIIVTLGVLFIQGLKINDLHTAAQWILAMSSAKTLYWFYSVSGLVFRPQILPIYAENFIKYLIPLLGLYYFRRWWIIPFVLVYLWFFINPEILIYAFPLIVIAFLVERNKLNYSQKVFLISAKKFTARPSG